MISKPKTPTQSKRGGKEKAIFSLQTERRGVSRPFLGSPLQSGHHTRCPLALPRGGVGRCTAPPACPGRAAEEGGWIHHGGRVNKLRPVLEPSGLVITSSHSRPALGAPFAAQSQEGEVCKEIHTKDLQQVAGQTSSDKPEGG
eukprot:1422718-Amphidinium_carterae.1